MMNFTEVYTPVTNELAQVENDIKMSLRNIGFDPDGDSIKEFSEYQINHICSALLLLSAKSANPQISREMNDKIVQMGAAMEFVYNAVIVHNNLSEKNEEKNIVRPLTISSNNKVSILGGDILYTLAFLLASEQFSGEFMQKIAQLTEKMCLAEIEQRQNNIYSVSQERYNKVIEDKTASFMAACCRFGAKLAGASKAVADSLEGFGLNFGMTYQIIQDCIGEQNQIGEDTRINYEAIVEADKFIDKAINALNDLPESPYKVALLKLLENAAKPISHSYIYN